MSEINTELGAGPPPAKRMRSTPQSVYFAPKLSFYEIEINSEKSYISRRTNEKWSIWSEESFVVGKKSYKIHLKYSSVTQFFDKFQMVVKIKTEKFPDGQLQKFEIESPLDLHVFDVIVPHNEEFKVFLSGFHSVPEGLLSDSKLVHRFDDPNRPHDIVLNFENGKLYCNKVVLAYWSNYFDRLFFSENADPNLSTCYLPDLKAYEVMNLLNNYLSHKEIHRKEVNCNFVDKLQMAHFLEVKTFDRSKYLLGEISWWEMNLKLYVEDVPDLFDDFILALELTEKYMLSELQEKCVAVFSKFPANQKKKFLAENEERLKKLSLKTIYNLMNTGLGGKKPKGYKAVFGERNHGQALPEQYKRNIDKLTDVTLVVGDEKFKVHKDYLAFWSPYFDRLFFGGFSETGKDEIELKEIDPEEFGVLLMMIYPPRNHEVDDANVRFLLKLADRFEFRTVMLMCGEYLTDGNSRISLMDILELTDTYNLIDAQEIIFHKLDKTFIKANRARINQLSNRMVRNILHATNRG